MSNRKLLELVTWTLFASLILSLVVTWSDLFSNESTDFKLLMFLGTLVMIVLIVGHPIAGGWELEALPVSPVDRASASTDTHGLGRHRYFGDCLKYRKSGGA